jgi:tetratricopeptide (TPR) repeat protein
MKSWAIKAVVAALLLLCAVAVAGNREDVESVFRWLNEGQAERADSACAVLALSDPANPYFAYLRSRTLYETGDYPGALAHAVKSLDNLPAVEAAIRDQILSNREYLQVAVPILERRKSLEGRHFIFSYINPKDSLLAGELFAVLDSAYEVLGKDLGLRPEDKVRVEAYPDRAAFIAVSTLTEDEVKRTGTIALCKFNRLLFVSPRALLHGYEWKSTLCHEYTHLLIQRTSGGRLPLWMHEAVARFEEQRFRGRPGGEMTLLEKDLLYRAVKNNTLVPLARMHPSLAKLKDEEESGTAYAEVLLAMEMIFAQGGYAGLQSLLKTCREGGDLDSALGGMENFEKRLFDYIRGKNFAPVEGISVVGRDFAEDSLQDDSFRFRKYVRLAEMLLEKRRTQAAIREMERADQTGKRSSPWIQNQIGLMLEKNGQSGKAREAYDRSILLFPEYCNGYFNRAKNFQAQGDVPAALKDLEAALDINPFHLPARELYAELLVRAGKKGEGAKQKRILEILRTDRS